MQLNEKEVRTLNSIGGDAYVRAVNEDYPEATGWIPVPAGCPRAIAEKIATRRAKRLGYEPAAPVAAPVVADDLNLRATELGL